MAPPSASSTATPSSTWRAAASAGNRGKALLLTRAFVADALDRIGEEAVREAFHADVREAPLGWHYLDSAATAQKPQAVIDAITRAYAAIMRPCTAASTSARRR
jgi:selenocysteine lyase/cysteine desulfurase